MPIVLTDQPTRAAGRSSGHLAVLDSLRGLMALWVVFGHIGEFSAYRYEDASSLFRIILHPDLAVDVFIILSGFVIAKLIVEKAEPYRVFIIRRFFRLWPAFAVISLVAIATLPWLQSSLAWHNATISPDEALSWSSNTNHFWAHVAASLPMLHGAIPNSILDQVAYGFVPPGWSISLEFQFYLVAPVMLWFLRRERFALIFVFTALIIVRLADNWIGRQYPDHSFLPAKLQFFIIGIVSYRLYVVGKEQRHIPWLLGLLSMAVFAIGDAIPLAIWLGTGALLLADNRTPVLNRANKLATHPWLVRLGTISYSVYLSHYILMRILKAAFLAVNPALSQPAMAGFLFLAAVPLTMLSASLLYTFIEKPGIRLGKKLTT